LNRILVSRLAGIHFAPTERASEHLRCERIPAALVHVTGNTGIDAILYIRQRLEDGTLQPSYAGTVPSTDDKLLLITAHRRESFGEGFRQICAALRQISELPGVQVVYPVHPNPQIAGPVREELAGIANLHLIEPLDYVSFVDLMRQCYLLLTDSGGIQEEAPSLGKPVLVLRETTERPEAVEAGTALIVGTRKEAIVNTVRWLLNDEAEYRRRTRIHNPFGDGRASERIADLLIERLRAGQATIP
jgi:UDP-N-acetylglucosamine 2-epimerase (non-hydrolysing)